MSKKSFTARIKHLEDSALGWRIVDVPFDVKKAFRKGGTVPVAGTVNGFAFRTSLFPRKDGQHFLLVNKTMQKGAHATAIGDAVEVTLELDTKTRNVAIPPKFADALEEEGLREYFDTFSYSMRKYFVSDLMSTKVEATRQKRQMLILERLTAMRDGETEPPPILQREFAHNPKAKLGWELLPVSHKRSHLWGIVYYRGEEARQKRLQKAIKKMMEYADKRFKPEKPKFF